MHFNNRFLKLVITTFTKVQILITFEYPCFDAHNTNLTLTDAQTDPQGPRRSAAVESRQSRRECTHSHRYKASSSSLINHSVLSPSATNSSPYTYINHEGCEFSNWSF